MANYNVVSTKDATVLDGMTAYAVSRNDGKKGKSGIVCVAPSVSAGTVASFSNDPIGQAWITDAIAGIKSKIISKLYAAEKAISDDLIGITAILAYAKAETENQRMTKDAIGAWFDSDLCERIGTAIRAKLPQGIADDKLAKLVDGYRNKFVSLAGRDVSMPAAVKAQLIRAMELLPEDYESVMGEKVAEALASADEATETLTAL